MITLYNGGQISVRNTRASVQFKSLYDCYGNCEVVRFWIGEGLLLFAMGGTLHIDSFAKPDIEELKAFISVMGFSRVYCSYDLAEQLDLKKEKIVIELILVKSLFGKTETKELKLAEIYNALNKSGGGLSMPAFEEFCVDFSHRLRHGGARYVGTEQGVAITTAETSQYALLGGIGVLEKGKGKGSTLLSVLCEQLQSENKTVLTSTTPDTVPFYLKNGFKISGEYCYCTT